MLPMSVADLARQADTIVLGTVIQQESAWNAQYTAINTTVTVSVERVLMGTSGDNVTFQVAGGIVGSMGMRTSNDPVFQNGERVIVCLNTSAVPSSVVGMQQGKFTVKDDQVTRGDETMQLEEFVTIVHSVTP